MTRHVAGLSAVTILVLFFGCAEAPRPRQPRPTQDYALTQLISMVEKNTQGLDRFRTKGGRLSGKMPTEKGRTQRYNLDGVAILYDHPRKFYLSGSYAGHQGLIVGSNKERYWLGVMTNPSRFYWGNWKNADRECNPWRTGGPMILLEAVGQVRLRPQPVGDEARILAGPALERRTEGNVLIYLSADEVGNWYVAKEVYLSPQPPIVVERVVYYDPTGAVEATVTYSDYRATPSGGLMAFKINIAWPLEESEMQLDLGRVTVVSDLPQAAFQMPDPGTFNEVEQVDRNCN